MTSLKAYVDDLELQLRTATLGIDVPWSYEQWPSLRAAIVDDEWGVHDLCTLTACRTPLHPGPCKGWKHTLHLTAPGVFHTLERERVAKANQRRVAKIEQLKSQGKPIPAALLKPITYSIPTALPGHEIGQKAEIAGGEAHAASHAINKANGVVKNVAPPAHPVTVDTAGAPKAPEKPATPGKTTLGEASKTAEVKPAVVPKVQKALDVAHGKIPAGTVPAEVALYKGISNDQFKALPGADQGAVLKALHAVATSTPTSHAGMAAKVEHARLAKAAGLPSQHAIEADQKLSVPGPGPQKYGENGWSPARKVPEGNLQKKHATAVANGTAPGAKLAKVQLAAYKQLSAAHFKELPEGTQKKILSDLAVGHSKFLDPKKKAEAAYVHEKLSGKQIGKPEAPKAEPHPANAVAHELETAKTAGAKGYNDNQLQAVQASKTGNGATTSLKAILKLTMADFDGMSYEDRSKIKGRLALLTGSEGEVGKQALLAHKLLTGTIKPVDTGPNEHLHNLGEQVAAHLGVQVGQKAVHDSGKAHDEFIAAVLHGSPTAVADKVKGITPTQFKALSPTIRDKTIQQLAQAHAEHGGSAPGHEADVAHSILTGKVTPAHADGKEHTIGESIQAMHAGTAHPKESEPVEKPKGLAELVQEKAAEDAAATAAPEGKVGSQEYVESAPKPDRTSSSRPAWRAPAPRSRRSTWTSTARSGSSSRRRPGLRP